jgi:Na+/H+ antiporter NhaD/arsenite permease-like protein
MISILVLAAVLALIAVRKVGNIRLQIWQIMLGGAIAVLVTLQISPWDAVMAINPDVMLFLFGMFVVGEALERSGYLEHLSDKILASAQTVDRLVLILLFTVGIASAFLLNDTLAIIGTPVVLALARRHRLSTKMLLLTLAFAVTIGSVMSPIGNPQNLLIAIEGNVPNPFVTFALFLVIPTMINLVIAFLVLKRFFPKEFAKPLRQQRKKDALRKMKDPKLARISKAALVLVLIMVAVKIIVVSLGLPFDMRLTYIALIAALPVILLSDRRVEIVREIDWSTLVFFASMFVLMQAVWNDGVFQDVIEARGIPITGLVMILVISVLMSQLISNVPLVALYLPMLLAAGARTPDMVALAAGSTIAGNLFILGAASNVIIIQNAEKRTGDTLTFLDFAKVGIPLTVLNLLVYWVFLSLPGLF